MSFANTANITGTWNAATGTLTLTGSDSVANYQAALRAVKYENTSDNPSAAVRMLSFSVSDGTVASNVVTRDVTVTPVNDAPVLAGIEATVLNYTEKGTATPVTSTISASDADNANLSGATVWISANYQPGQDVLSFTSTAGITGVWNAATGTLTLTGSDTVANYQAALRAVKYWNTSANPSLAVRTVSFTVNDGAADSNVLTREVTVTPVDDAPALAGIETAALAYTEDDAATPITATITVSDVDNTNLAGAVIQITGNYQDGQDVLSFVNTGNITGTWDAATGKLTLTGSDTLANYEAALRTVKYQNTSDNPSAAMRTVSFSVSDGAADSNVLTRDMTVTPVDNAPVLAAIEAAALAYTENDPATPVTATITVSDVDNANLAGAVIQITGNYQPGQDVLSFANTANITGTWDAATGKLTLSGSDSVANYEAALRAVTYQNTSDNPSAAVRTVSFSVSDGTVDSNVLTRDIAVTPVNDAPVLAGIEGGGAGLHPGRLGHRDHRDDHCQRRGQRQLGRRHDPDHRQLPGRRGRAVVRQHGQYHGNLGRVDRDTDPGGQRHRGQLRGGVAGREVSEYQRQSQHGHADGELHGQRRRGRQQRADAGHQVHAGAGGDRGGGAGLCRERRGDTGYVADYRQRRRQHQPSQRHDPNCRQLPARRGRAVVRQHGQYHGNLECGHRHADFDR